jgi:hypothetical protein
MTSQLRFPNPGPFYDNPCVSISFNGIMETISVGPLVNPPGAVTAEASVLLWHGPPATSLSATTALPIALNPGPYVLTPDPPNFNALIQQNIPGGASAYWSCTPQTSLFGSFSLFAQGVCPGVPPTWSPLTPINALNNVMVTQAVKQSLLVQAASAAMGTPAPLPTSRQDSDVFFAFGILHDHRGDNMVRLVVEPTLNVDDALRRNPAIARVFRDRPPVPPGHLTCVLGRERVVPPPAPFGGHVRLQYTGVIAAETQRRLCASEGSSTHSLDLERGELRQGILELRKREPTDVCLIEARLELAQDRSVVLGGFLLVA